MTDLGYLTAKEFQLKSLSRIIGGHSILGIAPEGAGKTTTYVLGVLMRLKYTQDEAPKVLVLAPDEDRIAEIVDRFRTISQRRDLHIMALKTKGGMEEEIEDLVRGVDIVVATPNRARAVYLKLGLNLNRIQTFIIDDAEEIVKQGVQTTVKELAQSCGKVQYLAFSTVEHEKLHLMIDDFMPFATVVEVGELPEYMIKQALHNLQINALNEMQAAALGAPENGDLILLSPTGSGKTLGFLLPLLGALETAIPTVQALIIVPSRELALQIEQVFKAMGSGFKVNCCYGGHSVSVEINNLSQPPAVLIGTPGRLAHHLRRKTFGTDTIRTLILDEFDKALELGFHGDMAYIIKQLPALEKRVLTSATPLDEIPTFTGITEPLLLDYLLRAESIPDLTQKLVYTEAADKLDTLFALICKISAEPTLVFCNHRDAVERISDLLWDRELAHDVFHGGMEQEDRERALLKFRNGSHRLLVTTDLASRGLDIPEIAHIIHYQLPHNRDAFLHRNGRTARMHATGTSYLLLAPDERPAYLDSVSDASEQEDLLLSGNPALPPPTAWQTLYIGAGKKEKINKVDIVGLLLKKGGLAKEDLGRIEVLDHSAYAAVKRQQIAGLVERIANEKLKGKRIKIEIAR